MTVFIVFTVVVFIFYKRLKLSLCMLCNQRALLVLPSQLCVGPARSIAELQWCIKYCFHT